jgi:hypothetical protein
MVSGGKIVVDFCIVDGDQSIDINPVEDRWRSCGIVLHFFSFV